MTDEELKELSEKVRAVIELEAPKARFIAFFFTGEREEKALRCTCTTKCRTEDQLGAIDALIDDLEKDDGIDRSKLLGAMIAAGSATESKEDF